MWRGTRWSPGLRAGDAPKVGQMQQQAEQADEEDDEDLRAALAMSLQAQPKLLSGVPPKNANEIGNEMYENEPEPHTERGARLCQRQLSRLVT